MDWFYIALLSPALFAVVNILDDNLLRNVYRSSYFGAIISGLFGMLPLFTLFFFPISISSSLILFFGLLAGFLTTVYYLFYFKALDVEYPSVVIALFSLTPAIVPFLAYLFLRESLTANQYFGFVLILAGSFAISAINIKKLKFSKALYLMIFASLLYAIIAILGKVVYESVDFYSGYMYFAMGMGLGAAFFMIFFREGRKFGQQMNSKFKKWIGVFVLVELVGISAEFVNNLAISKGAISLVKVIEGSQPMFVLAFAILLYPLFPKYAREAATGGKIRKVLCILVIIFGLYFVNR
jgi:drug/metabolite transporter (DMT)-like permease